MSLHVSGICLLELRNCLPEGVLAYPRDRERYRAKINASIVSSRSLERGILEETVRLGRSSRTNRGDIDNDTP